ncbi:MAG: hypothetical protein NW241_22540 [Bacteroidia bacterium]|nr:hypothetical protein [Bacteroidia bacterium]
MMKIRMAMMALALAAGGCKWLDPAEPLPVYIRMAGAAVQTDDGSGRSSAGIKDVWVDHNSALFGVYRLPSVVPLLPAETDNRLTFSGGIFENGQSAVRSRYPFWQPVSLDLGALPLLDTLRPALDFVYYPDTVLAWPLKEDFEGASISFEPLFSNASTTWLRLTDVQPFQGLFCAQIDFTNERFEFEAIGADFLPLPQSGNNDVYLEVAYRGDLPFTAGLYYRSGSTAGELPTQAFFPAENQWNIAYFHINEQIRTLPAAAVFKPFLRASSRSATTGQGREGTLFFDRIRIVHFRS